MIEHISTGVDRAATLTAFRRLIAPLPLDDFLDRYWTKAPLHLSGRPASWYDDIMTVYDLETFMLSETLPVELFRVMKDGEVDGATGRTERITIHTGRQTNLLDNSELLKSLGAGQTIEIDGTRRVLPTLTRFVDGLVNETMPPIVKIFVTPAHATGLTVHYDTPEVFTMQIAGTKQWTLYKQMHRLVSSAQYRNMLDECRTPGEPVAEFTVKPGDLLYIPGGVPYRASVQTVASISVGVGLMPLRWFDLFGELKERALGEEAFREHLPGVFSTERSRAAATDRFRDLASSYVRSLDPFELVRDRLQRFTRERAPALPPDLLRRLLVPELSPRPDDVKVSAVGA
jgi:ribosomal protein L16 Arg81 hydroxylase